MFQFVQLIVELLLDDADVLQPCEIGSQVDLQLVAEAVFAVFDGGDAADEDAGGKDGTEAACLHLVAHLETGAGMTWYVVEGSILRVAAVPAKVAEILGAAQAAADAGLAVEQRLDNRIVGRGHKHYAHDACAAGHAHLWLHAIGCALVDGQEIVASQDAVGDDACGHKLYTCQALGLKALCEGGVVAQDFKLACQLLVVVFQDEVAAHQFAVDFAKRHIVQEAALPFIDTPDNTIRGGHPHALVIMIELEEQYETEPFQ